jgi:hypothetical protein
MRLKKEARRILAFREFKSVLTTLVAILVRTFLNLNFKDYIEIKALSLET